MATILYQDKVVTLYDGLIVLHKYYFPLATSKTIILSDIQKIGIFDLEGVHHKWGITSKLMNNWFNYDSERKNKKKYIELYIKGGKKIKPTITPEDCEKVVEIIVQLRGIQPQGQQLLAQQGQGPFKEEQQEMQAELKQVEQIEQKQGDAEQSSAELGKQTKKVMLEEIKD